MCRVGACRKKLHLSRLNYVRPTDCISPCKAVHGIRSAGPLDNPLAAPSQDLLSLSPCVMCSFITYDEEGAIDKVFAHGRMHELAGKSVEVKRATPKGTGPSLGRGIVWRGYDQRADRAALEHAGKHNLHTSLCTARRKCSSCKSGPV